MSVWRNVWRVRRHGDVKRKHVFAQTVRWRSSVVERPVVPDFEVQNEPILGYMRGSKERRTLESSLKMYAAETLDIPIVIGGEEYRTESVQWQPMPHDHAHKVAKFYHATPELLAKAAALSAAGQKEWERVPWAERVALWLRAADLMAGPWRQKLNATTMLGQGKSVIQAEIDAAAELIDFFRFNAFFAKEILKSEPLSPAPTTLKNHLRFRGLEGFVAAISPFNFTAIGGNLAFTPALMGNCVLWKPSDAAVLSNYTIFQVLKEAGFPAGVVNFVPADGPLFGQAITHSPHLAAINFTGSVPTFQHLWKEVSSRLSSFRNFPRLVGECGGKNFHFVHASADVETVVHATLRSAFEYSGQKCSACSRIYVPASLWPQIKASLVEKMKELKLGPPTDFSVFTSALIDERAFDRVVGYLRHAKTTTTLALIHGGTHSKQVGFFVEPTLVETKDPLDRLMREEVFGPLLAVFVYADAKLEETLRLVDESTPYALTGAVFAEDEAWLATALDTLKYATGNFYINDRSTGAVVAQQPFGGARMSGTNDKAGGAHYVLKWTSPQVVKETFMRTTDWRYPYMKSETS